MRIVALTNNGTGHVLIQDHYTACGRRYPGALGTLNIIVGEPKPELHLCGNCERVIETGYKWFTTLKRQLAKASIRIR